MYTSILLQSVFRITWNLDTVHSYYVFIGRKCPFQASASSCLERSAHPALALFLQAPAFPSTTDRIATYTNIDLMMIYVENS